MRILEAIPRMRTGGAERVVEDLSVGFLSRGHAVGVASEGGRIADELAGRGVVLHRLPMAARRPPGILRAAWRLARILRGEGYDLIHSHSVITSMISGFAVRLSGRRIPHVFTLHHQENPAGYRIAAKAGPRLADLLTTVCEDNRRRLVDLGVPAERTVAIRNGIDGAVFPFSPEPIGRALGGEPVRRIAVVSRLIPRKGHRVLFQAFGALLDAGELPGARLLVIGEGPERATLERCAAEAPLAGRVEFLRDRPDVAALLPAVDLLVLASRSEGLPVCLVEALAVGVPVIATAVNGVPEVIRHGETGLLVPPGDPGALATAFSALCRDPGRRARFIRRGRELVAEAFLLPGIVSAYEERFHALLEAPCAASRVS